MYTYEDRMRAVRLFIQYDLNMAATIRELGYPKRAALSEWLKEDLPKESPSCVTGGSLIKCTPEQREWAVIQFCSKERTAKEIRADIGVSDSSLHTWKRRLLSERCSAPMRASRNTETTGAPVGLGVGCNSFREAGSGPFAEPT